jgi:hypothetical protein
MGALALRSDDIDGMRWLADLENACLSNGQTGQALPRKAGNDFVRNSTNPLHSRPPLDEQSSEESDMESSVSTARNVQQSRNRFLRSKSGNVIPIDTLGQNELDKAHGEILRTAFGAASAPIARIAEIANVNERTAKNWYEGKCSPGLLSALRLMAHVPEYQGEMRRLAAMESDIDPNFERAMSEAITLFQQAAGRGK